MTGAWARLRRGRGWSNMRAQVTVDILVVHGMRMCASASRNVTPHHTTPHAVGNLHTCAAGCAHQRTLAQGGGEGRLPRTPQAPRPPQLHLPHTLLPTPGTRLSHGRVPAPALAVCCIPTGGALGCMRASASAPDTRQPCHKQNQPNKPPYQRSLSARVQGLW